MAEQLATFFPVVEWLPNYSKANLVGDVAGGIMMGLVMLFQSIAQANIAGIDLVMGPYCCLVPPMVYALTGSSRHASIGSGSQSALLLAEQFAGTSMEERSKQVTLVCLLSGLVLILTAVFRLSFLLQYISLPSMRGFITGAGFMIFIAQVPHALGIEDIGKESEVVHSFFGKAFVISQHVAETNFISLILCCAMVGLMQGMKSLKTMAGKMENAQMKKVVAFVAQLKELAVCFFSITFSYLLAKTQGEGVISIVGQLPTGLPPAQNPLSFVDTWTEVFSFMPQACIMAFVTFLVSYGASGTYSAKDNYVVKPFNELMGLGAADFVGSFFGAYPINGSLSRTSIAYSAGVKTQASLFVSSAIVGAGLTTLGPLLFYMPRPGLAAIIINSAWSLVDFKVGKWFYDLEKDWTKKTDFAIYSLAFTCTLFAGVFWGIIASVTFSIVLLIYQVSMPEVVELGRVPSGEFRCLEEWPEAEKLPGVLIVSHRGPMFFANMAHFLERLEEMRMARKSVKTIYLSVMMVTQLDGTAIMELQRLAKNLKKDNKIDLVITNACGPVYQKFHEHFPDQKCLLRNVENSLARMSFDGPEDALMGPGGAGNGQTKDGKPLRKNSRLMSE